MSSVQRITIQRPQFSDDVQSKIKAACIARLQCRFAEAQEQFQQLLGSDDHQSEAQQLWLQSQIFKTQYQRGHYQEALTQIHRLLEDLDEKHDIVLTTNPVDTFIEYYFYKCVYLKAKLQRKVRLLTEAEESCKFLIEHVSSLNQQESKPKPWWKYAVKAAYIRVMLLASCMEFKIPKKIMETFALPILKKLLINFLPAVIEVASELPDNYYIFTYRRMWAKLRRLGYFVPNSDSLYQKLIFDELSFYKNIYDFTSFNEENPLIETSETLKPVVQNDATDDPKIQEVQIDTQQPNPVEVILDEQEQLKQLDIQRQKHFEKFVIDYTKFKVPSINFEQIDPVEINSQPIFQIIKTLHGWSKILTTRMAYTRCEEALSFIREAFAKQIGIPQNKLLFTAIIDLDLATLYLQSVGLNGEAKYDKQDRPLALVFEANQIVQDLIEDEASYIKAKVKVALGKVYLAKGSLDEARTLVDIAINQITSIFSNDHPIQAKFNQYLIEVLNSKPESEERTDQIVAICEKSVELGVQYFGEDSIYLVRPYYTLYTAKLHEATTEGCHEALNLMADLTLEGEPVRQNQYLYKAILIDAMMQMQQVAIYQGHPVEAQLRESVQAQLGQTFEKQVAYCEDDKNHPFLEEVVTILASYFENSGQYQNALIFWQKFLHIQKNLFGEDREQMITTYRKLASLAVSIGQPQISRGFIQQAQDLMVKFQSSAGVKTEEESKRELEDRANILFQQYLAAQQVGDYDKALEHVQAQTEVILQLHGEKHTKVCSNYFLIGQYQMRTGRFQESLKSVAKAFELLELLTTDFGSDLELVKSKFYMLQTNCHFILGNYEQCLETIDKGLKAINSVNSIEPQILRAVANTKRDMVNCRVRCQSKLSGKLAKEIRDELTGKSQIQKKQEMTKVYAQMCVAPFFGLPGIRQ